MMRRSKIRRLAERTIKRYGEGFPVNPFAIAASMGLSVEAADIGELSGVLYRKKKAILVNSKHPETRQRFAVAHALGHYLLHRHEDLFIDKVYPARQRALNNE